MASQKEMVHLKTEQETLLITLYAKAAGCPEGVFADPKAREILQLIDYDFSQLHVPLGTRLTLCLRARKIDEYVRGFLVEHPQGVVLHLGCGLDTRFERLDNGMVRWYDLDVPEVISLRKRFFQENDHYHMLPSSVTELGWLEKVVSDARPVFVVAEGLVMYLSEAQVQVLILAMQQRFPGSKFVFDAYSTLTVKRVKDHPSIKKTGAAVRWGIDDAKEMEEWGPGIRLEEEWYFTQSDAIANLSLGVRLMFELAGLFSIARKAHRILVFNLS